MKKYSILIIIVCIIFQTTTSSGIETIIDLRENDQSKSLKTNNKELSSDTASCMSFIPFWSGSWNAEFTKQGLAYVIFKTIGFAIMSYAMYAELNNKNTNARNVNNGGEGFLLGFLIYVGAVTADVSYSSKYIYNYNLEKGKVPVQIMQFGISNITVGTYLLCKKNNFENSTIIDGGGFLASIKF